ncbi:hypothetical protein B0H17DRAFT_1142390 [Mycena rosella]|uniref:Uncharacterized protein n=1 Tax=Mycena rosella TaxID=1033263 RepID=A0AAD7CXT0_MYCRO|nr:hypothetical protein B0H17DRAFT_1142390 [Mycena rosella]
MRLASRDQTRGRDRASDTFLSLELMPPSEGDEICRTCGHGFKPRGIASHEKACKSKAATMKQDSTFAANLKAQRRDTAYSRLINPKEPEERGTVNHSVSSSRPQSLIQEGFQDNYPDLDSPPGSPRLNLREHSEDEAERENPNLPRPSKASVEIKPNHSELDKLWGLASHKCTEFVEDTIAVPYKEENRTYKTYTRPIWDWVLSLVQDPRLASCFVWDAEKAYRYNGDTYVRFYHEPWTADAFWAAQSTLPNHPDAKVLGLIIYADNQNFLPLVVGHQPVVKDDTQENNKPGFSNFKMFWTQCGDDLRRWLWPMILILASDYEEACVMALIRGLNALYPCPICFVPWNEQSDLSTEHPKRTGQESEIILEKARAFRTAAEREQLLKDNSLRDVENVFWKINNTDPHAACSFDRLHAYGGLWTDHLFAQIKLRVTEKGRNAIAKTDKQMSSMPRWRGLNHFDAVMNITFNDDSKNEDIAKMMLFAAHNVLVDVPGVQLLQCVRSFLELNMYVSLEVHTSKTIAAGERTEYGDKSWNFPKMHSHQHVFDDIKNKGATRNFGTKISESMHGPIRQTYHRLTNFKNVTPQLIKHDHRRAVGLFIREQLEVLDAPGDSECPPDQETEILSNISIGSKLKPITFSVIEDTNSGDAAFARFRVRFADFLSDFLQAYGYNLPDGKRIRFEQNDTLVPFQFLKVHYEHLGNWTSSADYLRCNPSFHGHPRYDGALVKTTDGHIFVQLIYMFSCTVEKKSHPFGLVLPLDTRAIGRKDRLLRFHRLHAKPRKNAEFISAHSIIRGVLLAPDFDNYGEFLIVDIVDTDISLRLKDMYPDRY